MKRDIALQAKEFEVQKSELLNVSIIQSLILI